MSFASRVAWFKLRDMNMRACTARVLVAASRTRDPGRWTEVGVRVPRLPSLCSELQHPRMFA